MRKLKRGLQKKKIYNSMMAVAAAVLLLFAVLSAGYLRGWFDGPRTALVGNGGGRVTDVAAKGKKGITGIVRDGLSFTLKETTVLRDGDCIETRRGSMAVIASGENTVYLDESSKALVSVEPTGEVSIELTEGGAFVSVSEAFRMRLADSLICTEHTVFWAGAPYGSAGVHVFGDALTIDGRTVAAGQSASILQGGLTVTELSLQALNSFELTCAALTGKGDLLCFSEEDMEGLANRRREAQQKEFLAGMADADSVGDAGFDLRSGFRGSKAKDGDSSASGSGNGKNPQDTSGSDGKNPQGEPGSDGKNPQDTSGSDGKNPQGEPGSDGKNPQGISGSGGTAAGAESDQPIKNCTVKIACDTVLNHMDWLSEGKDRYIPEDGILLDTVPLSFTEGETAFDVLKRACDAADIPLEYAWTPMYNSYYVEGIGNLYEFDCGSLSGWVFEVDGWFPSYGGSSYPLSDGDTVIWRYTCEGLGKDVGGGM